jgi:hypothetical protein
MATLMHLSSTPDMDVPSHEMRLYNAQHTPTPQKIVREGAKLMCAVESIERLLYFLSGLYIVKSVVSA